MLPLRNKNGLDNALIHLESRFQESIRRNLDTTLPDSERNGFTLRAMLQSSYLVMAEVGGIWLQRALVMMLKRRKRDSTVVGPLYFRI